MTTDQEENSRSFPESQVQIGLKFSGSKLLVSLLQNFFGNFAKTEGLSRNLFVQILNFRIASFRSRNQKLKIWEQFFKNLEL